MSWTEVVIEVAREHAEALSDALMEAGALSVSVEDADEGTDQEKPMFGEPGMEPTEERVRLARPDAIIMHPGPMNRGVEIASEVADGPYSVILEQVANGVAVRMAVLYLLAGGVEHEAAA